NYFEFDPHVLYDIYVDNDGDANPDITYTLQAHVSVQNPATFLYNTGPINSINDATWNRVQTYTLTETLENGTVNTLIANERTAPVNIGPKSTPNYAALEAEATRIVNNGGDSLKIFAGQSDDPFWVDLQVFDLLTLRGQAAPIGYSEGAKNLPLDSLSGFNVHSIVIEAPISRLKDGAEPVLGIWSAARRSATRTIGALGAETHSGDMVQVSRLGMPLVNEAVIPLALKDAFNSIPPSADLSVYTHPTFGPILQGAVESPELGTLLNALYAVPLPDNSDYTVGTPRSGRGDIFDIFLTGMMLTDTFTVTTAGGPAPLPAGFNVNRPANVVPAEMIRINTDIKGTTCHPTPSRLGVLGGDACGFPNGRRLIDDVVEIELLAVAGAAYNVLDNRKDFTFNAGLIPVLDEGVDENDLPFRSTFPYLATAQSGANHQHQNILTKYFPVTMQNSSVSAAIEENPEAATVVAASGASVLLGLPLLFFVNRRKED
ncbi:MAG: DUF4331 domain-containing protein, partial [Candidatus Promineifilaceae bacterium]